MKDGTLQRVIVRTERAGTGRVSRHPRDEQDRAIKKFKRRFGEDLIEFKFSGTEHDRYIMLTRTEGTQARILIGKGLDFIKAGKVDEPTYVIIEDPYRG
jgi:hypothetical protein